MAQSPNWTDSAMDLDREDSPTTIRGESPEVIDLDAIDDHTGLTEDDFMTDEAFDSTFLLQEQPEIDRSATLDHETNRQHHRIIESYSTGGKIYKQGMTAELANGDFVRISDILEDTETKVVSVRGPLFRRISKFRGLFDLHLNELAMVMEHIEHKPLEAISQASLEAFPISEAVRIRDMVLTNEAYPMYSFRENRNNRGLPRESARDCCRLVCRWNVLLIYRMKANGKVCVEMSITRLRTEESDRNYRARDNHLREDWRGVTIIGGSCPSWLPGEQAFDIAERGRNGGVDILGFHRRSATNTGFPVDLTTGITRQPNGQRYMLGDAFCGGGGASRGAKGAGLRIDWGFDFDLAAIETYQKNFFAARCEAVSADVFISSINEDYVIDILHISPPCQTFSPFHVHVGKDDDMNSASFFAVGALLKKTKPRVVTLENTFGLVQDRWKDWLNSMVRVFTASGFSVRWSVLNLADYGLPQARRRLILIASCPGEKLPGYPQPTHGPGRRPYTTINDAIGRIPTDFLHHDVSKAPKRNAHAYNGNLPLRNCITTGGSLDIHPSGKRGFTAREVLCFQSFPLEHTFGKAKVKKQAGNAVPPLFALILFGHLRRSLEEADR